MRSLPAAPVALFLLAPPAWAAGPSEPAAPAGISCPLELATSIAGTAGAGPVAAVACRDLGAAEPVRTACLLLAPGPAGAGPVAAVACRDPGAAEPVRTACLRHAPARGDGPAGKLARRRGAELVPVEGAIDRGEPDGPPFEPTAGGGVLPRRVKP